MYSIEINSQIISNIGMVDVSKLKCHEEVVVDRRDALKVYLNSLNPEVLISSLIVCDKTNMIIDGHHRYSALQQLGIKSVPVTYVKYESKEIRTHVDNRISKQQVLEACLNNKLLVPKSTKHLIFDLNSNTWKPIILISTLFCLNLDLNK